MSNSFQESVDYLLSLGNEVLAMKLGLENIRTLLEALGRPQDTYLKVQVAGTNGKGSVCAFLNSICLTAEIRVGMFTSPHLVSITERVQVNGAEISEDDFARFANRVRESSERLVGEGKLDYIPTFFEQVTAIALLAFADAKVDIAILETGLGGRLDASTAANAEIAAITRIDYDHQQYLGETIEEIAAEKAAIIHEGSKVVALHQSRVVDSTISGRCREFGIDPIWATTNIRIKRDRQIYPMLYATFVTDKVSYTDVDFLQMLGEHQIENASIAIALSEVINDTGLAITPDEVVIGLQNATHPGRLERIGRFLLDGAHNPGGARALRKFLDEFVDQPITMVFGSMSDKDATETLRILAPAVKRLILTRPTNQRAMPGEELEAAVVDIIGADRVSVIDNVRDALATAREGTPPEGLILFTGSLYLIGDVKRQLTITADTQI